MHTWIGYAHPDRLISYPPARYLSACVLTPGNCPPTGAATSPNISPLCSTSCTAASNRARLSAINGPTRPRHHPRAPHTGPTRPVVTSKRAPARQDAPSLPQRGQHRDKTLPAQLARSQNGTKLSLLSLLAAKTGQNSPCMRQTAQNARILASRANFVTLAPPNRPRRANFVTENAPQRQCRTSSVSPSAARPHVNPWMCT